MSKIVFFFLTKSFFHAKAAKPCLQGALSPPPHERSRLPAALRPLGRPWPARQPAHIQTKMVLLFFASLYVWDFYNFHFVFSCTPRGPGGTKIDHFGDYIDPGLAF